MWTTPDLIGFICLKAVKRLFVFFYPVHHSLDAKFIGGTEYANGNFRTISNKQFVDLVWDSFSCEKDPLKAIGSLRAKQNILSVEEEVASSFKLN